MSETTPKTNRRNFLTLTAAIAGSSAAVGKLTPGQEKPESRTGEAADTYRETEHIRKAYERMRF